MSLLLVAILVLNFIIKLRFPTTKGTIALYEDFLIDFTFSRQSFLNISQMVNENRSYSFIYLLYNSCIFHSSPWMYCGTVFELCKGQKGSD